MKKLFTAVLGLLALCATAACTTTPPAPVPHWEHLPAPGYGDD